MIGEIFWSLAGITNEVLGDPIGGMSSIVNDAARRRSLRESRSYIRKSPSDELAEEKMRLYNHILEYEAKRDENKDYRPMYDMYDKWVKEYREKLELLK